MNHIVNCIIVDDEPLAILIIKEYCKRLPNLNLVATFSNAFDAMDCIKTQRVDLVFLDIEMPELTGVAFARELNRYPLFIFSTADSHHVKDSIDLRAVDYLLKPYDFERFNNAVAKASERLFSWAFTKNYADGFLMVNVEFKSVKVFYRDIWFVEKAGDQSKIYTADGILISAVSIDNFVRQLPVDNFVRVHKHFVVAHRHISSYLQSFVSVGHYTVPVEQIYWQQLQKFQIAS